MTDNTTGNTEDIIITQRYSAFSGLGSKGTLVMSYAMWCDVRHKWQHKPNVSVEDYVPDEDTTVFVEPRKWSMQDYRDSLKYPKIIVKRA